MLGDFESLWRYLEMEKEKWRDSNSSSLLQLSNVLNSASHSKKVAKPSKKKRVHLLVLPPVGPGDKKNQKKKNSKIIITKKEVEAKISSHVSKTTKSDGKKVHFEENPTNDTVLNKADKKPSADSVLVKLNQNPSQDIILNKIDHHVNEVKPTTSKAKKQGFWKPSKLRIPIPIAISPDPIHVFVDNSNILAGFLAYCREKQPTPIRADNSSSAVTADLKPKLDYEALFTILERGRNIDRKVLVASSPLYQRLEEAENGGYEVSVLRRVKRPIEEETIFNTNLASRMREGQSSQTGMEKEQCVDELLHLKILESLLDYSAPATLVLASGDGKDAEYFQGGFHKCVVMALNRGWKVEVISWQRQLSSNFLNKKFLKMWKDRYHVIFLDWFAKELGCESNSTSKM
ncbi:hypothetical protein G9A89_003294 [Geosiphon pyriformis]|nr:hypothetical protein G9A89_003294 [Geosiphon pyriformis]